MSLKSSQQNPGTVATIVIRHQNVIIVANTHPFSYIDLLQAKKS